MRLIILFSLFFPLLSFSETIYFNTNKSGMLLDEINDVKNIETYTKVDIDDKNYIKKYTFIKSRITQSIITELYSSNFIDLITKSITEDDSEIITHYTEGLITSIEYYSSSILNKTETYSYNTSRELQKIVVVDSENVNIYTDLYFRNKSGGLRGIKRLSTNGYFIHWVYQDGIIVENWLVEGDRITRTTYNHSGLELNKFSYVDSVLFSTEIFYYSENEILNRITKELGNKEIEYLYNNLGYITQLKVLEKGILQKIEYYEYLEDLLVKSIIVGHGKKEETFYYRDSEKTINLVEYYVNGEIKKKEIIENEDSEVWELYKDEKLYLKEYYYRGERLKKELFNNGKLFKSENFSE